MSTAVTAVDAQHLPLASSPNVVLVTPTLEERRRIWTGTHREWGRALKIDDYLARKEFEYTLPLSENGGLQPWLLTDGTKPPGERPILASCDTLRKKGLVKTSQGRVSDALAHGICSVFTPVDFRRRGYAGRMLKLMGQRLAEAEKEAPGSSAFSVLYSDIGKEWYANHGWRPYESGHLEFPSLSAECVPKGTLTLLTLDDLPGKAVITARSLRTLLESTPLQDGQTAVAVLPDWDAFAWHLKRADWIAQRCIGSSTDTIGVSWTSSDAKSTVWALFAPSYHGPASHVQENKLPFLRFVVQDENISDESLSQALEDIVLFSRSFAAERSCGTVELWNPDERIKALALDLAKLEGTFRERETANIPSLRYFGQGSNEHVTWIANDKYSWC